MKFLSQYPFLSSVSGSETASNYYIYIIELLILMS